VRLILWRKGENKLSGWMMNFEQMQGREWLVAARNEIQTFMLRLYTESQRGKLSKDQKREWHLLLGAVFSLWRAVFLVLPEDMERKPKEQDQDAMKYLERLIDANAITFADEVSRSNWTSGYYLNNARYRLRVLAVNHRGIQLREHISGAVLKEV
jgi:hypothetical protein